MSQRGAGGQPRRAGGGDSWEREPVAQPTSGWPWGMVVPGGLALALGLGLLAVVWLFARPLALVAIGFTIAQALAPLANRLARWMPRGAAVVIIYVVLLALIGALLWFALAPLLGQTQGLLDLLPTLVQRAQTWIAREDTRLAAIPLADTIANQMRSMLQRFVALPFTLASIGFDVILVFFLSLYALLAAPKLERFALSLLPLEQQGRARDVIADMGQTMGGYIRGVAVTGAIIGVATYIGLLVIGVSYPLPLALLAGLTEAIPIVGPFVSGAVIVVVALLLNSPQTALITLGFFIVLQQIESNLLAPNIMRSQTDIPSLLVLIALMAGAAVGELLGALVAIPVAGALYVLTRRVIAPAGRRWTGAPPQPAKGEES